MGERSIAFWVGVILATVGEIRDAQEGPVFLMCPGMTMKGAPGPQMFRVISYEGRVISEGRESDNQRRLQVGEEGDPV